MSILFLNANSKRNGSFVRPSGYAFPVGLSILGPTTVDCLVIAGGGGGSTGGGGAGGFRTTTSTPVALDTSYSVTVGAGGTAGDGSLTPLGTKIRAFMRRQRMNNSNMWDVWIDRDFIVRDEFVTDNPWSV